MLILGGLQSLALIQALGQLCGLRPITDLKKGKEMPIFIGIRRLALIQAFGPSCGLRPLMERRKTNIYAVVSDVRSGQEAFAKIGLRLGGFEARNGQKRIRSTETKPGKPDPKTKKDGN